VNLASKSARARTVGIAIGCVLVPLVITQAVTPVVEAESRTPAVNTRVHSDAAPKHIVLYEISGTLTNPWFGAEKNGVDKSAASLGVTDNFIATNVTQQGMVQGLQEAIAQHASGIAVHDWYPSAEDPEIAAAIKAGIPVIEVDAAGPNWQSNGVLGFIGQTDQEAGTLGAQLLLKAGKKDLLFVNHAPGAVNLATRWAAFQPTVHAAGGQSTQLNISFADSTNPVAVTQDIKGALVSNPNIDGVFTNGASIAEDAVLAVSQAGLKSKVTLGTTDLSTGDLNDIKNGSLLFALDSQPFEIGYFAVQTLVQDIRFGMHPVGQIATGPNIIDKANINQVLAENAQYPGIRGAA
jgi:simple sugar transport system substrate-binding protein